MPNNAVRWVRGSRGRLFAASVAGAAALATVAAGGTIASAVNADHGSSVVSTNPADFTPQVMNGSVQGITQIGNKVVAVGTFTTVRQTVNGANITRNANSVDTDGTFVYVGGSFSAVGTNTTQRRVAKLTAAGTLVPGFAAPSAAVNEVVVRGNRLYIGGAFKNV